MAQVNKRKRIQARIQRLRELDRRNRKSVASSGDGLSTVIISLCPGGGGCGQVGQGVPGEEPRWWLLLFLATLNKQRDQTYNMVKIDRCQHIQHSKMLLDQNWSLMFFHSFGSHTNAMKNI